MSSGSAVAAVLSGNEAAKKVRLACGATLPNVAAPGTLRFDYSTDSPALANEEKRPVYNLIHASDPTEKRDGVNTLSIMKSASCSLTSRSTHDSLSRRAR